MWMAVLWRLLATATVKKSIDPCHFALPLSIDLLMACACPCLPVPVLRS